jgi:DNA-binding MarR family transcriptional regulator
VLAALRREDVVTPSDLRRYLRADSAAVTRLLDRLESKSLIERIEHADDRRSVRIAMTESANEILPELARASTEVLGELHRGIAAADLAVFRCVVDRMLRNLGLEGASPRWLGRDATER